MGVRFNCREPKTTKKCGYCGYRCIPHKRDWMTRRMYQCGQCLCWECGHCSRFRMPSEAIVCDFCQCVYACLGLFAVS